MSVETLFLLKQPTRVHELLQSMARARQQCDAPGRNNALNVRDKCSGKPFVSYPSDNLCSTQNDVALRTGDMRNRILHFTWNEIQIRFV